MGSLGKSPKAVDMIHEVVHMPACANSKPTQGSSRGMPVPPQIVVKPGYRPLHALQWISHNTIHYLDRGPMAII